MEACSCALPQCKISGCIRQPGLRMFQMPTDNYVVTFGAPQGCICPPTSEQTCRADYCPRKSFADRNRAAAEEE